MYGPAIEEAMPKSHRLEKTMLERKFPEIPESPSREYTMPRRIPPGVSLPERPSQRVPPTRPCRRGDSGDSGESHEGVQQAEEIMPESPAIEEAMPKSHRLEKTMLERKFPEIPESPTREYTMPEKSCRRVPR